MDSISMGTLICLGVGTVLLVGALLDWGFLTDPPKEMFWCYSQSLLRLVFPRPAMRVVTGLMGAAFLIGAFSLG